MYKKKKKTCFHLGYLGNYILHNPNTILIKLKIPRREKKFNKKYIYFLYAFIFLVFLIIMLNII